MDRTTKLLFFVSLIVLFAGYVVIAVKVGRRRESRRLVSLARVATELGMGFTPEDPALVNQFGGITFSLPAQSTRATSVMRGTIRGSSVVLFDYQIVMSVGNNSERLELTVAAFDFSSMPLPVFAAEGGQGWTLRLINKVLPNKVIDFPNDPNFNRTFNVTGDDPQAVRRLLGPDARSFLNQLRTEWIFHSNGRWLVMYRSNKRLKPEDYRAFAEEASETMQVMTGTRV
jgi:hypothetical protein